MKNLNNKSLYQITSFIKDGFYPDIVKAYYKPKENDIADIFIKEDKAVLSIEFQGKIESPCQTEYDFEGDDYKKIQTLSYPEALAYLVDEGFILDNYESHQLVLRKSHQAISIPLKLNGRYIEYWNKNVEEVLA